MVKKTVSFIVIFLIFCTTGAALLIGTSNFGMGFGGIAEKTVSSTYALDRAGDIYYISTSGTYKNLVCIDSSGKRLFEKRLSPEIFGDSFAPAGIYVEHDKGIYLTTYEFDPRTLFIERAVVHSFYEDGTYAGEVFSHRTSTYMNGRTVMISAFSEDDNSVYFSLLDNGSVEVFTALKNNSEPASKIAGYELPDREIYGAYTFSDGSIALGLHGGIAILDRSGMKNPGNVKQDTVFDRFWNGIDLVYMMDSATGDIYTLSKDMSISASLSGSRVINAEESLTAADLTDVSVGITGNIFGCIHDETERLYYGSFSVMSRIYTDDVDRSTQINSILVLAAVAVGVILLTILTWDFYVSILKMHLSILLRQSLLMIMLIFIVLYSLSYFIVIPQVENIVTGNYSHEAQLIANSFEDSMSGAAGAAPQYSDYEELFAAEGRAAACADPDNGFDGDDEKPQVHLAEVKDGRLRLIASTGLYPAGTSADRLAYGMNLTDIAENMTGTESFFMKNSVEGEKMFLVRRISIPVTANDVYMIVGIRISSLSSSVQNIQNMIDLFLAGGGLVLVVIFMIIENITAGAVRKLKRSVDRIAAGEYNVPISISTGDEIEELSRSVRALSDHIVEKTTSLERLNNSYYRFVPLSFLKNLGETQIERVDKSLHSKRRMAVLLLRFRMSDTERIIGSQDIFESINGVFEQLIPIIGENGGTAYNFLYNGCSAIFNSSGDALRAAIKMRECAAAYNEVCRIRGKSTADVRVVISEGDVLLGFIGDEKRMEPTAVSGVITEAEEIEKLCGESGLYIVCTEEAFRTLPAGKYRSRRIGEFAAAAGTTGLYDMFDSDPYAMIKLKEQFSEEFAAAVELFENGDYTGARTRFMNIVKYAPDDGAARNYLYLAEHNISSGRRKLTYRIYDETEAYRRQSLAWKDM